MLPNVPLRMTRFALNVRNQTRARGTVDSIDPGAMDVAKCSLRMTRFVLHYKCAQLDKSPWHSGTCLLLQPLGSRFESCCQKKERRKNEKYSPMMWETQVHPVARLR